MVSVSVAVEWDATPLAHRRWLTHTHTHRGMDIMTYLKSGTGRHADSMG